jgi:hypothetical protein
LLPSRHASVAAGLGQALPWHFRHGKGRAMAHGLWLVLTVFAVLLGSAGIGMALRGRLHERHRTSETTDHVRLVVSILVTFTSLVLSLLLSEVKGSFDTFDSRLRVFAGDLANLDDHLREYGPDAQPIRTLLRQYTAALIADSWRDESPPSGDYPRLAKMNGFRREALGPLMIRMDTEIHRLEAPDGFHQRLGQSLRNQMDNTLAARRLLIETVQDTISWPLMLAMCVWLAVVFGVFGLLAPRNTVVNLTIVICAFCVASAIFVIDDFDSPLGGIVHVSSEPMRDALDHMNGA